MHRRVDEFKTFSVTGIEVFPPFGRPILVRVEIVPNDDDSLSGKCCGNGLQKRNQSFGISMRNDFANHSTRAHVECGKQRARSVTHVFELVSNGAIGRTMGWMRPGKCLHGFFVNRNDNGIFGRRTIKLADAMRFRLKFGILAVHPMANAVWAQATRIENSLHGRTADAHTQARLYLVDNHVERCHLFEWGFGIAFAVTCNRDDFTPSFERNHRRAPGTHQIAQ